MMLHNGLRLLPWSGSDGKPCYLSTDDSAGYMSRLADNIEAVQLRTAVELLELASGILDDQDADSDDLRLMLSDLAGSLRDVLRLAVNRGHGAA